MVKITANRICIFSIFTIVLYSCSTYNPTQNPVVIPTSEATLIPNLSSAYPYPPPPTAIITNSYPPQNPTMIFPSETVSPTPILSISPTTINSSCSSQYPPELMTIETSEHTGFCKLSVSGSNLNGYSIIYPETWLVRLAGAEAVNLIFNEGTDREIFLGLISNENALFDLENVDKVSYGFEMQEAKSLVDPNEVVISKEIKIVADKQILRLKTSLNYTTIQRYFLLRQNSKSQVIYVFELKMLNATHSSEEQLELLECLKI